LWHWGRQLCGAVPLERPPPGSAGLRCYAEGLEQGQLLMTTIVPLNTPPPAVTRTPWLSLRAGRGPRFSHPRIRRHLRAVPSVQGRPIIRAAGTLAAW